TLPSGTSAVRALFGEWRGGFLLATPVPLEGALERSCEGLPLTRLGIAGGARIVVTIGGKSVLEAPVGDLAGLREKGLGWLSEA
ncbi:MAG TPA: hypothetical protein VMT19_11045, partial [Thermoanaerobaculaceae bacterium]|nr:hypothetical protein [Thermoanaerobaculaceae bacterium]